MPYNQEISSDYHGLFVFVLDQSGSMAASWPGAVSGEPKSVQLADYVNLTLKELAGRCVRSGKYRRRADVVLIGYGGNYPSGKAAEGLWGGALGSRKDQAIPIPDLVEHPLRTHTDGDEVLYVWVEPLAHGGTPMAEGLRMAKGIIEDWLKQETHSESFPPVVFNITDGASNDDAATRAAAQEIQSIGTADGGALVISIHIPDAAKEAVRYPAAESELHGDNAAKLMFDTSSPIPPQLLEKAMGAGLPVKPGSRLMLANADPDDVLKLMKFGTAGIADAQEEG